MPNAYIPNFPSSRSQVGASYPVRRRSSSIGVLTVLICLFCAATATGQSVTGKFGGGQGRGDASESLTSVASISNVQVDDLSLCAGEELSVNFFALGFVGQPTFTAELSDASGSFAAPVAIGTVTGPFATSITAVIPPSTTEGTGYRIRVVSNTPQVTGSDNGSNITIIPLLTWYLDADGDGDGSDDHIFLSCTDPCDGSYAVNIGSGGFLDETTWTMSDINGTVIAQGGPYGSSGNISVSFSTTQVPLTFALSTIGTYNDNTPNWSITSGTGAVLRSGTLAGGNTLSVTGIQCSFVNSGGDCDDDDPDVTADDTIVWYEDADGDGLGDPNATIVACEQPPGYVAVGGDDCPLTPGTIGSPCGPEKACGIAFLDEDCQCVHPPSCAGIFFGGPGRGDIARNFSMPIQLPVAARAFLEGPYNSSTGLMNDALRTLPDFPLGEPYTTLGYGHSGGGGGESIDASVLAVTGDKAVVDWVLLEIRASGDPSQVVASRSALLLRDGSVVDTDGVANVGFDIQSGQYHIAILHRNHLGVMLANTTTISAAPTSVTFTSSFVQAYGTQARKSISGTFAAEVLWAGDVTFDGVLQYTGFGNDRDPILSATGGLVPTNTVDGYYQEDVNLDGTVKYTGPANDRDVILQNIGGTVPTNIRVEQMP